MKIENKNKANYFLWRMLRLIMWNVNKMFPVKFLLLKNWRYATWLKDMEEAVKQTIVTMNTYPIVC